MLSFKELLNDDINSVFLDEDVFADEHVINGETMRAVISEDTLKESGGHWEGGVKQSYGTGIYSTSKKLYVKKEDFGKRPKIGNPIQVDGADLTIKNFDEQQGMYVITIDRRRQ